MFLGDENNPKPTSVRNVSYKANEKSMNAYAEMEPLDDNINAYISNTM